MDEVSFTSFFFFFRCCCSLPDCFPFHLSAPGGSRLSGALDIALSMRSTKRPMLRPSSNFFLFAIVAQPRRADPRVGLYHLRAAGTFPSSRHCSIILVDGASSGSARVASAREAGPLPSLCHRQTRSVS